MLYKSAFPDLYLNKTYPSWALVVFIVRYDSGYGFLQMLSRSMLHKVKAFSVSPGLPHYLLYLIIKFWNSSAFVGGGF